MKNLLIRKDLRNNAVVFDVDTEGEDTIKAWDGIQGHPMEDVSLAFYRSTVPLDDKAKVEELIKGWTDCFGDKEIIVRQRLIKRNSKVGSDKPVENIRPIDVEKLKRDLLSAFSKALETI